ncbi:MAG TPA: transglutaminaseTgpA domain-containing protein [Thermoleophilaceae bacterium]
MSAAAGGLAPARGALASAAAIGRAQRAYGAEGSLAARLAAFAALAGFGAAHWMGFVAHPPGWRAAAVVAIATGCGAALAASARPTAPRAVAVAVRAAMVAAALAAAAVAIGLQARLLLPASIGELRDGLDAGLAGTSTTSWPYSGGDSWVRLALLLGVPAATVPAAALAFWPARRAAAPLRLTSLALLVALFAVPATEHDVSAPLARGALLLALAAAWLWLPRLRARDATGAAVAVLAAGAVGLPLAAGLAGREALIDYRSWTLFGEQSHGKGNSFDWDHSYGPIEWSRSGETLLRVRSRRPHYWKAETLDAFDGVRWYHSGATQGIDAQYDVPPDHDRSWDERIGFEVHALRSRLVVGAGTVYAVRGDRLTAESGDGTIEVVDEPLQRDDAYSVLAYVPRPSAEQMRATGREAPLEQAHYTSFDLPRPDDSALRPPARTEPAYPSRDDRTVTAPFPGMPPQVARFMRRRILASPYRRAYLLARRLAAGQATAYDVARRIQRHLEQGYDYTERPPLRPLPLDAFLFRDRRGYCQQFSGAMALLLRMNGIPARVAGGFAPGIRDVSTGTFRVRDLDAHSWVEVYFAGIGWVEFDPTPALSPATRQRSGRREQDGAGAGGDAEGGGSARQRADADLGGAAGGGSDSGSPWLLAALVAGLAIAGLGALWAVALVRARRVRGTGGDPEVRELVWALERLGHPVAPGTTLLALERRLAAIAPPAAAGYVRALRERRYARLAAAGDPRLDRRALRGALTSGAGPVARARGLLALPPRRRRPAPPRPV